MIAENQLQEYQQPVLADRDQAEDAWEARLIPVEIRCPAKCDRGWHEQDFGGGWFRCALPGCDQGDVLVALCVRCSGDDNSCGCSVSDFLRAVGEVAA